MRHGHPLQAARLLAMAGAWDHALSVMGGRADNATRTLTAEILVDRHWWRLDDPASAEAAVGRLEVELPSTQYLLARLAYQRLLFQDCVRADDEATAERGFGAAATGEDEELRAWGTFYLGVLADNVADDPAAARDRYEATHEASRRRGDLLLESYVLRHLSAHVTSEDPQRAELLLRRSLHLRAALGARPLVAAAQASLASALPDGAERALLIEVARSTAEELGLTWLLKTLPHSN